MAAPITVSYNLKSVPKLQLSGTTFAKIFALKIKTWNDAAIAADNPGVTLPSTAITVAHRADSSARRATSRSSSPTSTRPCGRSAAGTPSNWASLGTTQAGNKNTGVAQIVKSTDGAIGYVDLADAMAANLQTASIKNKSGAFVPPTLDGAAAAVAGATVAPDLSYDPINAPGATAYPITSPTWIIAYAKQTSHDKGTVLKAFLQYIYGPGQTLAPTVGYAALPPAVVQQGVAQLSKLQIPA